MVTNIYAYNSSTSAYDAIKQVAWSNNGTNIRSYSGYATSRNGYSYIGDTIDALPVVGSISFPDILKTVIITSGSILQADQSDYNIQNYVYSGYAGDRYFKAGNSTIIYGNNNSVAVYKSGNTLSAYNISSFSADFSASSTGSGSIPELEYVISVSPVVEYSGSNGYEIVHAGIDTYKTINISGGVSLSATIPSGANGIKWTASYGPGNVAYDQGTISGTPGTVVVSADSISKDKLYEYSYDVEYIHLNSLYNPYACMHGNRTWVISNNSVYKSNKGSGRYAVFINDPMKVNSNYDINTLFSCGNKLIASSSSKVSGEIWELDPDLDGAPSLLTSQYGIISSNIASYNNRWYFMTSDGIAYYDSNGIHIVQTKTPWVNEKLLDFIDISNKIHVYIYNDINYNKHVMIASNGVSRIVYSIDDGDVYYDIVPGNHYMINYDRSNISYAGYMIYSNNEESSDDGSGILSTYIVNGVSDFEDNPAANYKLKKIAINVWSTENPSSTVNVSINYREWDSGTNQLSILKTGSYTFSIAPYNGFITREYVVDDASSIKLSNSLDMNVSFPNSYGKKIKSISLYFERVS